MSQSNGNGHEAKKKDESRVYQLVDQWKKGGEKAPEQKDLTAVLAALNKSRAEVEKAEQAFEKAQERHSEAIERLILLTGKTRYTLGGVVMLAYSRGDRVHLRPEGRTESFDLDAVG